MMLRRKFEGIYFSNANFQFPNGKRVVRDPFVRRHTENAAWKKSQVQSPQFKCGEQPFPGEKLRREVLQRV